MIGRAIAPARYKLPCTFTKGTVGDRGGFVPSFTVGTSQTDVSDLDLQGCTIDGRPTRPNSTDV